MIVLLNLIAKSVCYNALAVVRNLIVGGRDMAESKGFGPESDAVRTHLEIMQGVVSRMGDNSRTCKIGAITLVAAVLFLSARSDEANVALVALAPAALFWVLDAYYLSLERAFRASYDAFVAKVHGGSLDVRDLYGVRPSGSVVRGFFWAVFGSFSVSPFYLMVAGTVGLAWMAVGG